MRIWSISALALFLAVLSNIGMSVHAQTDNGQCWSERQSLQVSMESRQWLISQLQSAKRQLAELREEKAALEKKLKEQTDEKPGSKTEK